MTPWEMFCLAAAFSINEMNGVKKMKAVHCLLQKKIDQHVFQQGIYIL